MLGAATLTYPLLALLLVLPPPPQVDPFFVPTTEEELEEYGTEAGGPANLARRLIDAVRRRKGLPVEEKVVAKATKQRTLKRNV
jgi:ribosome assembly protein 1